MTVKEKIIKAVLSGNAVLFLGAGASASSNLQNGDNVPLGNNLAENIHQHFYPNENYDGESLQMISSSIQEVLGSEKLHEFLYELLNNVDPSKGLRDLTKFKWHNIYTTNIEQAIENAYKIEDEKSQELITVVGPLDQGSEDKNTQVTLHKLHGCITRKDIPLVFSLEDYANFKDDHLKLFDKLSIDLVERQFIFIGYSMQDVNFQKVWSTLNRYCNITTLEEKYFFVGPNIKESLAQYLNSKNIDYLDMTIDKFGEFLINNTRGERQKLEEYYMKNIAPAKIFEVTELTEKDKYELSKDFEFPLIEMKKPYKKDVTFYKGAEPLWKDIKYNLDANRDLLNILLKDFKNWFKYPKYKLWVITGGAGDGKSTLLKRLSVELANRVGENVFFAHSRSELDPKRIVEFQKHIDRPIIILLDNIADRVGKVSTLINFVKQNDSQVLIIGAARTSDWNIITQESLVSKYQEYQLSKLSDGEITKILGKLRKNNCLNYLSEFSKEDQFDFFKNLADRELIVALREATTNKKFDEIIASEFSKIKSEQAKKAYLYVCIVNQLRYRIPQSLLIRIMNMDFSTIYENIFKYTEGIIYFDKTRDEKDFLLRARHSVIAEVVVNLFCKTDVEKYDFVEAIISSSIPSSPLEKSLQKKISHHSTITLLFKDMQIGINCYNMLSEQFPDDSLLLQQKALFLSKNSKFEEAKSSIEEALRMYPTSYILRNSKGTIYLKESLEEDDLSKSIFLRDKGKDILLKAIRKSRSSNPYHYHSLINHLIKWYKKFNSSSEELIEEIHSLLEEGTKNHPNDSYIMAESGKLNELLENIPKAKRYFKKAIELDPRNMSARFLLSKILIKEGENKEALKICTEGTLLKKDEVLLNRLKLEIMHELDMDKANIDEEYHKYFDTIEEDYYIKVCYAAYLYINKDDNCSDYFKEMRYSSNLSYQEKHNIYNIERHLKSNNLKEIGYVDRITPSGYLLKTERFNTRTSFYCHNKIIGKLEKNERINCIIRFSPQGPVAIKVKKI
ncbi:MAG: SIR2 family protein [Eubacteriales bacterium]